MSRDKPKVQFETDHEGSSRTSMPVAPVLAEHPEFYYDDSLVVIQVENTLFRIHKYQLIKSETFSDMFKIPTTTGLEEGASREHPIVLDGVKSSDFAALLKVLYASHFSDEKPKCEPEIIVPALRLAHMWNFAKLRAHLLTLVKDTLGCVDKIVIGRELGIQEWLAPAHVELCQREEPLTREEGTKLGIDSTVLIFRLREQFRTSQPLPNPGDYCSGCAGISFGNYTPTSCRHCRKPLTTAYRYTTGPRSTSPPTSNIKDITALEAQVGKWVEDGRMTE